MAISRMIDRVGHVLGGRYRLIAPIGTGASASVYLADDVVLRRRVAVKILHDALAHDPAFLERFQSEARAAAALNHPHVMAVFDWGQGDVPYLVTEYLGGGSLRAMLDLDRELSVSQGLVVGLEAARGLAYAHRRGFVHRDIKPANLLFDEDGRLRIADFGLARALAEAAWTEPMGAVLGTARYASPEQARGEQLDGRSDVYSLAVVLVEAVSGEPPFTGDTPFGLLMARVDKPLPVPDELGPLAPVLRRAGEPDPAERIDAAELERALLATAGGLDRPSPLPLAGAMRSDQPTDADRDPTTQYLPERIALAGFEPDIMSAPPGTTSNGIAILKEGEPQPGTRRIERTPTDDAVEDLEEKPDRRERRARRKERKARAKEQRREARGGKRRKWPYILTVLFLLVAGGAGAFGYWYTQVREITHPVPSLVGMDIEAISAYVEEGAWILTTTEREQAGTNARQILDQDPAPGTSLKEGATLALVVSLGPPPVPVPTELDGVPLPEAEAALVAAQLALGDVTRTYSETVPSDHVISLAEGVAPMLYPGSPVGLVVSDGPSPRTVPSDLVGDGQDDAVEALEDLGLSADVQGRAHETVPAGIVIEVPQGGQQVPRGATVVVVVSTGPPLIAVPQTAGSSVTDAAARLGSAGLTVTSVQGSPVNPVVRTSPPAGEMVRRGTEVTIFTG